jgi:hypothetical protein
MKIPKFTAAKAALAPGHEPHARAVHDAGGTLIVVGFQDIAADLVKYAPGCGSPIHVAGTNGGAMPCGARLTQFGKTEQQFCGYCERNLMLDIPRKKEVYSVAARKLTPEELKHVAYLCEKECRIFHEDPRAWPNYDVFIGHQINKFMFEYQIGLDQLDEFIKMVHEGATDV